MKTNSRARIGLSAVLTGLIVSGAALASPIDCVLTTTIEAVEIIRLTVCLNGKRVAENEKPIVQEASVRIENVGADTIEISLYSTAVESFRVVIGGNEGLIMKPIKAPMLHGPASEVEPKYVTLMLAPGQAHVQKVDINELLAKPPLPGQLYRVLLSPSVSFETPGKTGTFSSNFKRMDKDPKFDRPIIFHDVRLR